MDLRALQLMNRKKQGGTFFSLRSFFNNVVPEISKLLVIFVENRPEN